MIALAGYEDVQPERLSELLNVTSRLQPGTFFNIFARMVHDKLDREGVEVGTAIGEMVKTHILRPKGGAPPAP